MKVSVCMITYNHQEYLADAIASVLMQKANFDYELVIGEDCSTDDTRAIVVDFRQKYPDRIRVLLHDQNQGLSGKYNFVQTLNACQGEYVAVLEGDDYWTSPYKLQRQVDFLEGHPTCAICFHNVTAVYEDGSRTPHSTCVADQKAFSTIGDLLVGNFIPTCSVMFRRGLFTEFPNWYFKLRASDWALHILNAQHGSIGYINQNMGIYRIHRGGLWSGTDGQIRLMEIMKTHESLDPFFEGRYHEVIVNSISHHVESYLVEFAGDRSTYDQMAQQARIVFKQWPSRFPLTYRWKRQMLARACVGLAFNNCRTQSYSLVRYWLAYAIRDDPGWLGNRGFWSLTLESFVGCRKAKMLRRILHSGKTWHKRA